MNENPFAPDAAQALPGAEATVVAFRSKGQLYVTVVAKATFAFAPDADMPRVEPQPILHAEVHHGGSPVRSLHFGSDLAPYLGRADVLFTGYAHAPPPGPAHALNVRLAIFRSEGAILDKSLSIRSARGFQRLPIVYENAFGGPGVAENPLGVGATADAGEPAIFDPKDLRRPGGFGPLARTWPARKQLLGQTLRKVVEAPIAEIPDSFDWSYFQVAPLDQRIDFLRGDEWIVLEGLHPTLPLLRTRLPRARGVARIFGLSAFGTPDGSPLDLYADTLRIQGEDQRSTLVCRRSIPVPDPAALGAIRVVAGVALGGEPIAWLEPRAVVRVKPPPAPAIGVGSTLPIADSPGVARAAGDTATLALADWEDERARAQPTLPFSEAQARSVETLALVPSTDEDRRPAPALPFQPPSAASSPPPPRGEIKEHVETGTLALSPAAQDFAGDQTALPFIAPLPIREIAAAEPAPLLSAPPSGEEHATGPAHAAPDLGTVPYFVPAPPAPPAPSPAEATPEPPPSPPPEPDPTAFPIERFAAISAEIAEERSPRADVLRAHALAEGPWGEIARHWKDAIAKDAARGPGRLRSAYDSAYVAAVEDIRGPITAGEYARLVVSVERRESDDVLGDLHIQRPALMSILRVWAKKVAADPKLFGEVNATLTALRAR